MRLPSLYVGILMKEGCCYLFPTNLSSEKAIMIKPITSTTRSTIYIVTGVAKNPVIITPIPAKISKIVPMILYAAV